MRIISVPISEELRNHFGAEPTVQIGGSYVTDTGLSVLVTVDAGLLHLSVAHRTRYPRWDEIKQLRYELLPDEKTFGILLPPKAQYVNVHPNCFHLHELPQMHEDKPVLWLPKGTHVV